MTEDEEFPERAADAFADHEAFEPADAGGFAVTTTRFGGRVAAADTDDWAIEYALTVRAPTLESATTDEVGDAVAAGWFETFERRLEDAPQSTRADVDLAELDVAEDGPEVVATLTVAYGNADRAPEVLKAMAEYVEGTYVEGIVPGYEYTGAVADLLDDARSGGGDGGASGSMPL
ncbi:MAG: DUF5813 family protein [Haloarculaceae archaeon]